MSELEVLGEPVRITVEAFEATVIRVGFFNGKPSTPAWADRLAAGLESKYGRSRTSLGDEALPDALREKIRATRLAPPYQVTVWPTDSTMAVVLERDDDGAVTVEYHDLRRSQEQLQAATASGTGASEKWELLDLTKPPGNSKASAPPAASTDLVDAKGSLGGIKGFQVQVEGIDADAGALDIRYEKLRDHVAALLRRKHIVNMEGREFRDVKEPGVVGVLTILVTAGRSPPSGYALNLSLQVRQVAALPFSSAATFATTWQQSFLCASGDRSRLSARLDDGLDGLLDKFAADYAEARRKFLTRTSGPP